MADGCQWNHSRLYPGEQHCQLGRPAQREPKGLEFADHLLLSHRMLDKAARRNLQDALVVFVRTSSTTTRAGFPATTAKAGTSFTTTAPAATMAPSPIVTPFKTWTPCP